LRGGLRSRAVIGLCLVDLTLFGVAGRANWMAAWIFTALFAVYLACGAAYFVRRSPRLLEERLRRSDSVPKWDRALIRIYRVLLPALFAAAALDAGRFRWSHVPLAMQIFGLTGVLAAFAVIWWCTASNPFLSSRVRLQADRGHQVVQDGPYRFVRHPMYASLIVLMFGTALLLGSWLAILRAALIAVLVGIRAAREDRFLAERLAGYAAYAARVPSRLVPGFW
jgi:protein-S-isoprenylcysteine O-methyltransferase Ste14